MVMRDPQAEDVWVAPPVARKQRCADSSFVYFIYGENRIKIGRARNVYERLSHLQIGSPTQLSLMGYVPGGKELEKTLHKHLAEFRGVGEWFHARKNLVYWIEEFIRERGWPC